ncbi:response regulator [Nocardia sputi]|uniref:response regulator n=1 Tax=Nocardia sputi TaxID=2943705 RepID=UPI0020BF2C49|nr:response regulator [Nocardia sputi]
MRSGSKVLPDLEDDIAVVGEATTGAEAVELARATRPDVALMDICMPSLDGIHAAARIAETRRAGTGAGPDPHHLRHR